MRLNRTCEAHCAICIDKRYNAGMDDRIDAVFENGVFRPQTAVPLADGERVWIHIESVPAALDDLRDVADLLEPIPPARNESRIPTLDEVRQKLSVYQGSLAELIIRDREEP